MSDNSISADTVLVYKNSRNAYIGTVFWSILLIPLLFIIALLAGKLLFPGIDSYLSSVLIFLAIFSVIAGILAAKRIAFRTAKESPQSTIVSDTDSNIQNDDPKENGSFNTQISTLGGIAMTCYCLYLLFLSDNPSFLLSTPDIELSTNFPSAVNIHDCEIPNGLHQMTCLITYKPSRGGIIINSLKAVYYDKDGVRLGVEPFPRQNVLPNETIKEPIVDYYPIKEVATIKVSAY